MKKFDQTHAMRALHILSVCMGVIIVVGVAFGVSLEYLKAQGGTPFGGQSTYVFYCTCSGGIAHTITDLTTNGGSSSGNSTSRVLVYQAGATTLYPFGQIFRSGVWTLGLWTSGGTCTYYVGVGCSSYNVDGQMMMVGTSM